MQTNYEEFDDVVRDGPYADSAKARAEVGRIMRAHGLSFTQNPGGGEFYGPDGFRCQISMGDDIADLAALRAALKLVGHLGIEPRQ